MTKDNPLVYSTASGRIIEPAVLKVRTKGDGIIRISRQSSGRKGKGVSIIRGFDLDQSELFKLAATLKKKCGCGGTVADDSIEIQGDKRELLQTLLLQLGYKVKLVGG